MIGPFQDPIIHMLYAGENVRPEYIVPAPDTSESEYLSPTMRVISLEALVRMKLTSFRLHDQVHLMDLNDAGLIDAKLVSQLPSPFAKKLKVLIHNPNIDIAVGIKSNHNIDFFTVITNNPHHISQKKAIPHGK